jgi:hypothetical protein
MDWKKLLVLAGGIALGEYVWVNFLGEMLVGEDKILKPSPGIGADDFARYGTSAAGVLVLQQLL